MVESSYKKGKYLGKGSFGHVYICTRISDGKQLALKEIKFTSQDKQQIKEEAKKEADLMRRQQHEYLIKCEDYQEDSNGCYIYMELALEDLETFIQRYKKSGKYIPEKVVLHIIFQILHGLSYLHKNNIIHRDIKPLNILMIGLNCKLSDFGGSRQLSNEFSMAGTKIGTPYYVSPEILHKSKYSFETDVWSFGVTLYQLCTLTFPFPEPYRDQTRYRTDYDESYSREIRDLIDLCLEIDPKKRLSVDQILNLSLLKEFAKEFNLQLQRHLNVLNMGLQRTDTDVNQSKLILRTSSFKPQYFPSKKKLNWNIYIVGVRQYGNWPRFQFIFSDNTVSKVPDSKCDGQDGKEWKNYFIPNECTISKVDMMMSSTDKHLYGLKFYDKSNEVLKIDSLLCKDQQDWQDWQEYKTNDLTLTSVELQNGERLVGIKSTGKDYEKAFQCEFQFIIGKKNE